MIGNCKEVGAQLWEMSEVTVRRDGWMKPRGKVRKAKRDKRIFSSLFLSDRIVDTANLGYFSSRRVMDSDTLQGLFKKM